MFKISDDELAAKIRDIRQKLFAAANKE